MKVLIAAGGTGGHFYPGLAVARALIAAGHSVSFVVREGDYVLPLLEREKISFFTIKAAGFKRRLDLSNLVALGKVFLGMGQALLIIRNVRPDVLLVMGGYLSFAPAVAARLMKIPLVLHEQNAVPGLANRTISHMADAVAVSFHGTLPVFGAEATLTGNPVRIEFKALPSKAEAAAHFSFSPDKPIVLVFGGSLGANRLNSLVVGAIGLLKGRAAGCQFLHFTGPGEESRIQAIYKEKGVVHHVAGYCHEMASAYAAADLVLCRAGASTLAELIAVRKPALLVPYPLATGDHQTKNAELIVRSGAAILRQQKSLTESGLAEEINLMINDQVRLERMASAYDGVGIDPFVAAERIRDLVVGVGGKPR